MARNESVIDLPIAPGFARISLAPGAIIVGVHWTPKEIAAATSGSLVIPASEAGAGASGDVQLTSVVIDSRTVGGGELFVAVRAERDGHDFVRAAVEAGAAAVLVEHSRLSATIAVPSVEVADTRAALLDLGSAARARVSGEVVGITGSVGKTSTKDLTRAALTGSRQVAASQSSFNNELGVPLTLVNSPEATEVVVIEMGARGRGHIALLCQIARPTVAVVTSVAAAHTEMFGDLEAIASAKGELVEALPPGGTAILNGDDERVSAMASRTSSRVIRYSATCPPASADLIAERVSLDSELRPRFRARTPWGDTDVVLEARGAHQVGNGLAALGVAGVCGVPIEVAAASLREASLSPWRMELLRTPDGAVVLNDAYNANPASMAAALQALAALPARRRVALLGEMAELGSRSAAEHLSVAHLADQLNVELIAIGTDAYGTSPVADATDAVRRLGPLDAGTAVLVKGSRVAGLERVADVLVGKA